MTSDDYDWDEHDRKVSQLLANRRRGKEKWLTETAKRISTKHKVANSKAVRRLLISLTIARASVSGLSFDHDSWYIPRDLTPWKDARAQLVALATNIQSARIDLDRVLSDRVMLGALQHSALRTTPKPDIPSLVKAFFEIQELVEDAASIEGKRGNRPHPEWMNEATKLCRKFWRQHTRQDAVGYFHAIKKSGRQEAFNSGTEPANPFSRWFCDVMNVVGGLTPSQCDTLLRH